MTEPQVRATILVTGRVQGVFFRATAMEQAQRLGLVGWVKNLPDGGVESVVEGPRQAVEEYVRWCHGGPPSARVDDVRTSYDAPRGEFRTFQVA